MKIINQYKIEDTRGYNICINFKFYTYRNLISFNSIIGYTNILYNQILYEYNTSNLYMGHYKNDNKIIIRYRL